MPKPLISDEPYPSAEGLSPDPVSARIISTAYATGCGELNSILQYIYQSFIFAHAGDTKCAELVKSVALAEMIHLNLLGNALANLGAQPVFTFNPPVAFNFYSAKFVSYTCKPKEMLEDDVAAEKHAVAAYEKMLLRLKNRAVRELIARLLKDERLHLEAFARARSQCSG